MFEGVKVGWVGGKVMGLGWGALGHIDVGVCYTRGAGSRLWRRWWGRGGRWGRGGGGTCSSGMHGSEKKMR